MSVTSNEHVNKIHQNDAIEWKLNKRTDSHQIFAFYFLNHISALPFLQDDDFRIRILNAEKNFD